jgi:mRNA-degrading endonuclease RelE of RelBE toxin-antitoxin system
MPLSGRRLLILQRLRKEGLHLLIYCLVCKIFMDKIQKALLKFTEKERRQIKSILTELLSGQFEGLDLKKLKGREDIFRVRKGTIRIIYRMKDKHIFILTIERKKEKTYKSL